MEFKNQFMIRKEKKLVNKDIFICINCGSDNISHNDYTLHCDNCYSLHFYEVAVEDRSAALA